MQQPESNQARQLLMAKGQSHFAQLRRGTVIRAAAGSVALVQRMALDHCTLVQQTTLRRGAVHCVAVSAWVEIRACADAELFVLAPCTPSVTRALRSWLCVCLERLAGRRKHKRLGARCAT